MILYLIRHGRSNANEQRLVTGTPDDELTAVGCSQAVALSAWLKEQALTPDRFLVSHWQRARQTAEIVFPDADWLVDSRLGETNAGTVANLPLTTFVDKQPNFYDDPGNAYPGGESHLDLYTRVMDWLDAQFAQPCRALAVVCHTGPISCVLQHVLQISMTSFPAFLPLHATVSVVHFSFKSGIWQGRLAGFSLGPAGRLAEIFHGDA